MMLDKQVVKQGLSVRATEALVRRLQSGSEQRKKVNTDAKDPDIQRLENELSEQIGNQVTINYSKKGKGTLQIAYNSLDELEGILSRLKE